MMKCGWVRGVVEIYENSTITAAIQLAKTLLWHISLLLALTISPKLTNSGAHLSVINYFNSQLVPDEI